MLKHLTIAASILGTTAAFAGNMIYNGGFELGTDGFALHRIITRKDMKHIPLELDSANAAHGKQAVKVTNPDGDYFEFYASSFDLKPNTEYIFSMYAKTDVAGGIPLESLIHTKDWDIKRKFFDIKNKYAKYSFRFNSGKGGPHVIRFWSFQRTDPNGGWKGNLWLDDVSVTEAGAEETGNICAAVSAPRYWMHSVPEEAKLFTLKLQNGTKQKTAQTLTVRTVSEYDGKTVAEKEIKVELNPGEVRTVPVPEAFVPRYGSYIVSVDGTDIRTLKFPYVVIGEVPDIPRNPEKDFVLGINSGLGYRDGYTNRKLITRRGFHSYNTSPETTLALLRRAGFRLVREWDAGALPVDWGMAEPENGKFDFSFFDLTMKKMKEHGLIPVHVLGGELFRQPYLEGSGGYARRNPLPAWVLPLAERPAVHPENAMQKLKGYIAYPPIQYWTRYMTELAKHSKGEKQFFEFTNEPNLYVTPQVYRKYLKATYTALKKGDPNAKLIGFCATPDFKADGSGWLARAFQDGGLNSCDIVSFHPYDQRELASIQPADKAIQDIFAAMKRFGRTLPVWNTELYYLYDGGNNDESRPEYWLNRALVDCGEGVSQSISLANAMAWRRDCYLNYTGEVIPSVYFAASNTLARLFEGAKPVAKHRFLNSVICYVFRKDGKLIAAVWNYQRKKGLKLDLSRFTVLDLFGNPVKAEMKTLDANPFYLRQGKMSDAEFLKACSELNPMLESPIQPSDSARLADGCAIFGLQNESNVKASCTVGFQGGGFTALHSKTVTLNPEEHCSVELPLRAEKAAAGTPSVILLDNSMHSFPVRLTNALTKTNGETWRIASKDGKLSATLRLQVKEKRFFLTAQVKDSSDAGVSGMRKPWETDSIELFADTAPLVIPARFGERYTPQTFRVFLTPRDAQPFTLWSETLKASDFKWKITPDPQGYTAEVEGPAGELPFGFALKVNDAENAKAPAVRSAAWAGKEAHANRFDFGLIREAVKKTETEKMPFDGTFESGKKALDAWEQNFSSKSYPASLAANPDFFSGIRCMKLTASPEDMLSVIATALPFVPGKKVAFSGWAKGEGVNVLDTCIELWKDGAHTGKHLYTREKFKLQEGIWTPFRLVLEIPANAKEVPDIDGGAARVKIWLPKTSGFILLDELEFRILP